MDSYDSLFHRSTFCDFEPCLIVFVDFHPHPLSDWNNYFSKAFAQFFYFNVLKNSFFCVTKNRVTFKIQTTKLQKFIEFTNYFHFFFTFFSKNFYLINFQVFVDWSGFEPNLNSFRKPTSLTIFSWTSHWVQSIHIGAEN